MLLELFGFLGLIIGILVIIAEQKKPVCGIFASVLLLVTAYWCLADGIQIKSGETQTSQDNGTSIIGVNTTSLFMNSSATSQNVYVDIPSLPFIEMSALLGLLFILLGIYGVFHYVWETVG